jgi:hypothetical protein
LFSLPLHWLWDLVACGRHGAFPVSHSGEDQEWGAFEFCLRGLVGKTTHSLKDCFMLHEVYHSIEDC